MRMVAWSRVGIGAVTAAMLALMVAASGAAASVTDEALRQAVERRLAREAAVADRVEVTVRDGAVTLEGTVATLWEKEWAIDRAQGTDGVRTVAGDLIIGSPENDQELGGAVGQAIVRYPYYSVFDYVDVTVENGVVTLRGDVTARPDKPADLYERVSKVRGVQAIVNELGGPVARHRRRAAAQPSRPADIRPFAVRPLSRAGAPAVDHRQERLRDAEGGGVRPGRPDPRREHRPPDPWGDPGAQRAGDSPGAARGGAAVARQSPPLRRRLPPSGQPTGRLRRSRGADARQPVPPAARNPHRGWLGATHGAGPGAFSSTGAGPSRSVALSGRANT